MVVRAVALLAGERVVLEDRLLRAAVMRAKHHKTMEHLDEESVMAYLRAGRQEAIQTDTADATLRQDVLLRLVQEGSQES